MSDDEQNDSNTRGLPYSQTFNFGTTIRSVFRNIDHAFANSHDAGDGQRVDDGLRDHEDDIPPLEPVGSVAEAHNSHPTGSTHSSTSSAVASSASASADADMPPSSQFSSQRDDDEESMPDLRSLSDDSSNDSDAGVTAVDPVPSHQPAQPADPDHGDGQMNDEDEPPPLEPITGTRRARVDDDGDDARDRRHPSERVSVPPPQDQALPQGANQQPPPRPTGLFGAFFGLGPPGDNVFAGEAPPEHTQTGEDNADPSPAGNDAVPGRPPGGVPILTAGFTLTIPLFGSPPGNQTGPAAGGQGPPPNLFNMDATAREELFASFAAFLQEFQAMDDGREDPERAKKLVAGLEVVPLGLVKRLERVGGAPGGHVGDAGAEASSGCAICWDTLLDGESDNFTGQQSLGDEAPRSSTSGTDTVDGQNATYTSDEAMDVDASSAPASHSDPNISASASESPEIISLPCAHVFHASCLLPWFTRARQATCPTCRFNIDPENLTYTPPPRRAFNRGPPAQPDNAAPNPAPAAGQNPSEAPATGAPAADAAPHPVDPPLAVPDARPATTAVRPGGVRSQSEPAGGTPADPGFNPFAGIPGIPVLSFPAIQIPLGTNGAGPPEGGNQGIDMLTIGLDMFVGGLPPEGQDPNPRGNTAGVDAANNGGAGTGPAGGNGPQNPNGLAQDLQTLIEGLLRTTRNIIPQVINAQGPAPPPVPGAPPAAGAQQPQAPPGPEAGPQPPVDGAQPQSEAGPAPEAAGPQAVPPPPGGARAVPPFPFRPMMFRPTRSMPPRRERKTWTLPPAPGPSLRQHVEQREREEGLRCSDMSCGVGPSDEDPFPEMSPSLTKQILIHPLPTNERNSDVHESVCAHAFHPSCLVSAERVAGWGGKDKAEPLVEVSCPVCRAVGCVTREEWESGVAAF